MNTPLIEMDEKSKINLISTICSNDLKNLRNFPLQTYNLNFLIESSHLQFDKKITPLLASCFVGKYETTSLILNNEYIDVNLASYEKGYTPIMVACFKGYYDIIKKLLENKADVTKANSSGQTPILFCFSRLEENRYKYENKKICMMMIELILAHGADINVRIDKETGYTVLMKLCSMEIIDKEKLQSTLDIIIFIIERGANKSIVGNDGKTVFELVKNSSYYTEIMEVLNETEQCIFYSSNKIKNESNDKKPTDKFYENLPLRTECCIFSKLLLI